MKVVIIGGGSIRFDVTVRLYEAYSLILGFSNSNLIRHLISYGVGKADIEKIPRIFFQRKKCSAVEVTKPCGLSKKY
jgi:hypothetical protein